MLTPIRIFEGAFSGATVYANSGLCLPLLTFCRRLKVWSVDFISPTAVRSAIRHEKGEKYRLRKEADNERQERREEHELSEDELAVRNVFA